MVHRPGPGRDARGNACDRDPRSKLDNVLQRRVVTSEKGGKKSYKPKTRWVNYSKNRWKAPQLEIKLTI